MIDERKILLTINLEGGLTQISKIVKNKKSGKKSRKNFKIPSLVRHKISLGEEFIKHSMSLDGRPGVRQNFNVYANWKKMKPKERLEFHIKDLVTSIYGVKYPLINRDYTYKTV
jgi:hypothetical protein